MISNLIKKLATKKLTFFETKGAYTAEEISTFYGEWKLKHPLSFRLYKKIEDIESTISYYSEKPKNWYYYLRNRFIRRYHLIDTRLSKGSWWDIDTKMLYGNMNMLVDYVEKEDALNKIEWNSDPHHQHARKEIEEIYAWWKDYERRKKENDNILDKCDNSDPDNFMLSFTTENMNKNRNIYDECQKAEDQLEKEEEEMLIRLIKIRGFLWT